MFNVASSRSKRSLFSWIFPQITLILSLILFLDIYPEVKHPDSKWPLTCSCTTLSPLTKVRLINELNKREADLGVKESVSWHAEYKDSAWIFVGELKVKISAVPLEYQVSCLSVTSMCLCFPQEVFHMSCLKVTSSASSLSVYLSTFSGSIWLVRLNLFDAHKRSYVVVAPLRYGEIVNINLVRDKKTGKSKGFCFICYEDQRSTILAVDNLNSIKVKLYLGRN